MRTVFVCRVQTYPEAAL